MGTKKHKKHKSERKDRYEEKPSGLKLILKVGSSSTPEHDSSAAPSLPLVHGNMNYSVATGDDESRHSSGSLHVKDEWPIDRQHRKAKKKKKKKEKDKDKHEKKHKHHHKEKRKRPRDESSQDDVSMGEESLSDPPLPNKRVATDANKSDAHGQPSTPGSSEHHGQSSNQPSREPRTCVLRQRQERTSLQKLLDHLLKTVEKKDPQQFFAWPVTDHIAPGYSQIIQQPMDFSTMKQKIDDNLYPTLNDFLDDFKLMCDNAMVYNHPETIYYKAAKKLLHVGLKMMSPEKLKTLQSVLPYMGEMTRHELGFDIGSGDTGDSKMDLGDDSAGNDDVDDSTESQKENKRKSKDSRPLSKFEAIPDDLSPEEILEQAQKAAKIAADRLSMKRVGSKMGFMRQNKDGSTSLAILVPSEGVTPGTNERPISLGMLTGKLTHGTGQLQGFREDRRNVAKTVKPLYYGAFGSYAPSYDSTFANLTKEESDLVYQTYGDETAVQYAESILDFSKDCDYALTMVDNLLDLLTNGEHSKTKGILEERKKLREEEERIRQLLETRTTNTTGNDDKGNPLNTDKVDFSSLKSLSDLGVDTKFLDEFEKEFQKQDDQQVGDEEMQSRLEQTSSLLQKLQQVQSERLSLPPPPHLSLISHPSENEIHLAEKITENLKDMAKKVPPSSVTSVSAIRKAMGILPEESTKLKSIHSIKGSHVITHSGRHKLDTPARVPANNNVVVILDDSMSGEQPIEVVDVEGTVTSSSQPDEEMPQVSVVPDLESELREFLESDPTLSHSPLQVDPTIEEIFSEP